MVLVILKETPLAPLQGISQAYHIPEPNLTFWIQQGKLKVYPILTGKQYKRRAPLNLIDLNSLAIFLGKDVETVMKELQKAGVGIFVKAEVQ